MKILQFFLYLFAFIMFGVGDGLSGLIMIERQGIIAEANPLVIYIVTNFGLSTFFIIKILFSISILMSVLILQKMSSENNYWTINGFLISFIIIGTILTILNIQAMMGENTFLSYLQVIILFLIIVWILTHIGERFDKKIDNKIDESV